MIPGEAHRLHHGFVPDMWKETSSSPEISSSLRIL